MGDAGETTETQKEVPETIAAQDEYTRSFLVSTEEASEGHYAFKPWTEAYTMWIPVGAKLSKTFYEKREKHWERFSYNWQETEGNTSFRLIGLFEDRPDSEEIGLDHLTFYSKIEGDYEKFEEGSYIYYYANDMFEVGENKIPVYSHIGFIKHKNSDKSLGIIYESRCSDWTLECDSDTERIKNHFWELVKSVKFDD